VTKQSPIIMEQNVSANSPPSAVGSKPSRSDFLSEGPALLPHASFAYVYGSFGTPRFGQESDVDIAVHFGRPLTLDEHIETSTRLEGAFHRRVDLIDACTADPIIACQILKTGRLLFVRHPTDLYRFQMKTLASYLDEKLDRRIVEDAMIAGVTP
jgi:predicted nucleotidyltransferase